MRTLTFLLATLLAGCPEDPAAEPVDGQVGDTQVIEDTGLFDAAADGAPPDAALPDAALPDAALPDAAAAPDAEPGACTPGTQVVEAGAAGQHGLTSAGDSVVWLRGEGAVGRATRGGEPEYFQVGGSQRDLQVTRDQRFVVVRGADPQGALTVIDLETGAVTPLEVRADGAFAAAGGASVVGVGSEGAFVAELDRGEVAILPDSAPCTHDDCALPLRAADGAVYYGFEPAGRGFQVRAWFDGPQPAFDLDSVRFAGGVILGIRPGEDPLDQGEVEVVRLEGGVPQVLTWVDEDRLPDLQLSPTGLHLLVPNFIADDMRVIVVASGETLFSFNDFQVEETRWLGDHFLFVRRPSDCPEPRCAVPPARVIRATDHREGWLVPEQGYTTLASGDTLEWTSIAADAGPDGHAVRRLRFGPGAPEQRDSVVPLPAAPLFLFTVWESPFALAYLADGRFVATHLETAAQTSIEPGRPSFFATTDAGLILHMGSVLRTIVPGEPEVIVSAQVTGVAWQGLRQGCATMIFTRCTDADTPCDEPPGVFVHRF